MFIWGFPGSSVVKDLLANAGDSGSIPGLEWSPGEGNGNPLQYSCLENPMDGGAWWFTVHEVAEFDTTEQLSTHAQGVHLQAIDRQQVTKRHISSRFKPQRPCLPPPPTLLFFSFFHSVFHTLTHYQFTCMFIVYVSGIRTVILVYFMCSKCFWYHIWLVSCHSVNFCWTQFNQIMSLKSLRFW